MFCASNLNDHVRTVVVWQDLWRVLKVIDWRLRSIWCASSSPILTTQRPLGFHVTQCFGCYASRILLVLLNQLSSCCHLVLACPCMSLRYLATICNPQANSANSPLQHRRTGNVWFRPGLAMPQTQLQDGELQKEALSCFWDSDLEKENIW